MSIGNPILDIGKVICMEKSRTAFGQRMFEARKESGLTQKQVQQKAGIAQATLSELENDAKGSAYTPILAALYGFNALYLAEGKGPKRASSLPPGSFVPETTPNQVPVVGKGMGGLPDAVATDEGRTTEGFDEYAETYSSDPNAFVTRVEGNSMYPKYCNGDYALVEPNTAPELEDEVLIKVNTGQVMLKRLMSRRGGIHLGSYNETQTYTFQSDEIVWMYYVAHPVPARKIRSRFG